MRKRSRPNEGQSVCLGLVIVAQPGQIDQAMAALATDPRVVLGDGDDRRCAASVVTAVGRDEELLGELTSHPSILAIEVVYAQVLADEEAA